MTYQTGFKELTESDEKKFLAELGMSKWQLEDGMKRPQARAGPWGTRRFRAPVDIWIEQYRKHAESLDANEKAALHRTINRLFFSLKEGQYVSHKNRQANLRRYRNSYIIPKASKSGPGAKIWLKLAGSYTQALLRKNKEKLRQQEAREFETKMPIEWLDVEAAAYNDAVQKRAFGKFVKGLSKHWLLFVDSYRNEVHGAVINNSPYAASLQSFLKGRYPDGTPLKRPHSLVYWPEPLSHYAAQSTARSLFEAKKAETDALKPILSGGAGSDSMIYSFPRWLRLGIDNVDPRLRPPVWKPKPSR